VGRFTKKNCYNGGKKESLKGKFPDEDYLKGKFLKKNQRS